MLIQALNALLPIQLSANAPEKAAENDASTGSPSTQWGDPDPTLTIFAIWCSEHEPVDGRSLSPSLPLFVIFLKIRDIK